MSLARSLNISIVAKLDRFNSGLASAQNKLQSFAAKAVSLGDRAFSWTDNIKGLDKIAPSLAKVSSGATGALASLASMAGAAGPIGIAIVAVAALATGLAALYFSQAPVIDQTNDLAQRIGTSYTALATLGYAAQLSGSDAETLGDALEKLGIKLDEATKGSGPASEALKKLGLNAAELAGKDRTEAFKDIADTISQIQNPAEQAAAAVALFGKQGVKVLGPLKEGKDRLSELQEEAKKFGLALSQTDVAKVGDAQDALDRVSTAFKGLGTQAAAALAPAVEATANVLSQLISVVTAVVTPFVRLFGNYLGQIFGHVAKQGEWVAEMFRSLGGGIQGVLAYLPILGDNWTRVEEGTKEVGQSNEEAADKAIELAESIEKQTKTLQEQVDAFGKSKAEALKYKLSQEGATEEQLESVVALQKQLDMLEANKKAHDDLATAAKSLADAGKTEVDKFWESADKLDRALMEGILTQREYDAALGALRSSIAKPFESPLEKFTREMAEAKAKLDAGLIDSTSFDRFKENATKSLTGIDLTPMQKYRERIKDLFTFKDQDLLDEDTLARQVGKAKKDMFGETKLASALDYNSVASVSLLTQYRASANDPVLAVNRQQLEIERQMLAELQAANKKGKGVNQEVSL